MLSTSELADEIENSYSSNFVEDIILSEADRKLIVSALRRYAQPAPSSPVTETLREVIAGIVDPGARFQDLDGVTWSRFELERREMAYRKADSILAITAGHAQTPRPSAFLAWAVDMFGPVAKLRSERLLRFVEEAIELAHAEGTEREVFNRITDRVYSRPAGVVSSEVGQAQACLELFAESIGLSSADEAQREWERVQGIPRAEWERRHATKAAVGITATLCSDCPPVGYETDRTRCLPCPRRVSDTSTICEGK